MKGQTKKQDWVTMPITNPTAPTYESLAYFHDNMTLILTVPTNQVANTYPFAFSEVRLVPLAIRTCIQHMPNKPILKIF